MSKPHFNDANIDIYSETTKLFNIFFMEYKHRGSSTSEVWRCNQRYRGLFSLELRVES